MKRIYNQSNDLQSRKRRFNPACWEISVDHSELINMADRQRLKYQNEDNNEEYQAKRIKRIAELMVQIRQIIISALTERQQEIVELYFFHGKTEYEIAASLGITASSVSQHLFGKKRSGRTVGGAIPRLRKEINKKRITNLHNLQIYDTGEKEDNSYEKNEE